MYEETERNLESMHLRRIESTCMIPIRRDICSLIKLCGVKRQWHLKQNQFNLKCMKPIMAEIKPVKTARSHRKPKINLSKHSPRQTQWFTVSFWTMTNRIVLVLVLHSETHFLYRSHMSLSMLLAIRAPSSQQS